MDIKQDIPAKEEKQKEPTFYEKLHTAPNFKDIKDMAEKDAKDEESKETGKEDKETEPAKKDEFKEKVKEVKEKRQSKSKEELVEEAAQKAKAATLEAIEESKKKEQEENDKKSKEEERKAKLESPIKPKWTEENRTPKTYEEIVEEAVKAADARAEAKIQAILEERDRKAEEARQASEKQTEEDKKRQEEYRGNIEKQLMSEVEELREIGKLPRVEDPNNPEDEGVKAYNEFMAFGTETNNKRLAEGKMPLFPMSLMNYYTPKEKQPAGADAPIIGNSSPEDSSEVVIPYEMLHKMGPREIANYIQEKSKKT